MFYVTFIAALNIGIGFAIALGLGLGPQLRRLPSGWSPSMPELFRGVRLPRWGAGPSEHTGQYDEMDNERDETAFAMQADMNTTMPQPDHPLPPGSAEEGIWQAVSQAYGDLEQFRSSLTDLDLRTRQCVVQPENHEVSECIHQFREVNRQYLDRADATVNQLDQPQARSELREIGEAVRGAFSAQLEQVQQAETCLAQMDNGETAQAQCEQLLSQTSQILESNCRLAGDLEQAKSNAAEAMHAGGQLGEPAAIDELTQLSTRRTFEATVARYCRENAVEHGVACFAAFDIDACSAINAEFGHAVGNQAIGMVARLISSAIRKNTDACRYQGEQFVLFCPSREMEELEREVEQARQTIAATKVTYGEKQLQVTVRAAVAEVPIADSLQEQYLVLQKALDAAKQAGGNRTYQYRSGTLTPLELQVEITPKEWKLEL